MKATVHTKQGAIEVEGDTQSELFKAMAACQEVFDEQCCGLCGCKVLKMVVRKNKEEDEFFEYQCKGAIGTGDNRQRCGAYLALGQNKKGGGLFPIRALDEKGKPDRASGKYGRHMGWTRFRGEPKKEG